MGVPHPPRLFVARVALAMFGAALASSARLPAQKQAGPGREPVTIEFRVLTAGNEPVLDLKPEEVTLKVSGRAREIRSLELVRHPTGQAGAAGPPAALLPLPFASNFAADPVRELLIVIDDEAVLPGKEQQVRDAVGHLLAGLSARDNATLLTVPFGGARVGPTTQHDEIRSALAGFVGRASRRGRSIDDLACHTRVIFDALRTIFAGASGEMPTTVVLLASGLLSPLDSAPTVVGTPSVLCEVRTEDLRQITAAAAASRADFHVVQVVDDSVAGLASSSALTAGLNNVAGLTGNAMGRLSGDGQAVMTRLVQETSAYYRAVFEPEASERNGSIQRLDLQVGRDGVKVRARSGIRIPKPDDRFRAEAVLPARDLLRAGEVSRDLPLRATSYAARNPDDDRVKVVVLFEPADPSVRLTSAAAGLITDKDRLTAQWTADAADLKQTPVLLALVAPAGTYRLRVVAVDGAGRVGTVDSEGQARLARAGPATLSGLVLAARGDSGLAPRMQFGPEPAAVGYLEIYGVARTAPVSASLELAASDSGPAQFITPMTIPSDTRGDYLIAYGAIPIASLPPGDYQVRAIVSLDGRPVARVVRTLRKVPR